MDQVDDVASCIAKAVQLDAVIASLMEADMDRKTLQILVASILTSLLASDDGAPEGPMYAALMAGGYSLNDFQMAMGFVREAKLVTVESHWVRLTDKGRELAQKLEDAITAKRG